MGAPRAHEWGAALILHGFLHGAWYAGVDLYRHEAREAQILKSMLDAANAGGAGTVVEVASYGSLGGGKGSKNRGAFACHRVRAFGDVAVVRATLRYLSERWKRRWVMVLLIGSVILPVFVSAGIEFRAGGGRHRRHRRLIGDRRVDRDAGGRSPLQRTAGCRRSAR